MEIKAADTLMVFSNGNQWRGYNFLSKSEFDCDSRAIEAIAQLHDWTPKPTAIEHVRRLYGDDSPALIEALLDLGALVAKSEQSGKIERDFAERWGWSLPSAILHFSVQGREIHSLEQSEAEQIAKAAETPAVPLVRTNGVNQFPLQPWKQDSGLRNAMAVRRTHRNDTGTVSLEVLTDCLFSGLGITGWTENCVQKLPLKMTPSGGARNPYDAYVHASGVDGLKPGLYHYSAVEHSLELVTSNMPPLSDLMGGQDWADNASCGILLCATWERSMWKYEGDDNAYRVALIEAGHIGQNVALSATEHGCSACPSAALDHDLITNLLDLDPIGEAPVYCLALTAPAH